MDTYKFGNLDISQDQYDDLNRVATLGSMGLLPGNSGAEMFANILMTKPKTPSILEQYILGQASPTLKTSATTPRRTTQDRKGLVLGLYNQGITDTNDLFNSLNYDEAGNQIGDFTRAEIESYKIPEEEGRFGFGTGKGELFGEGGALGPSSIPRQIANLGIGGITSGIINPAAVLIQTGGGILGDVLSGKSLQESLASPERDITKQKALVGKGSILDPEGNIATLMSQEEYMQDPALAGLKSAAAISSFAPVGVGVAGNVAKAVTNPIVQAAIKTAIPAGISAASAGFAGSEPGKELEDTLKGGLLGLGTGAVLGAGGKILSKALKNDKAIMAQVDKGIENLKKGYTDKGVSDVMLQNYAGNQTNARMNYITGNLRGEEQKAALKALLGTLNSEDKYSGAVKNTIKTLFPDVYDDFAAKTTPVLADDLKGKAAVTDEIQRLAVEDHLTPVLDEYGIPKVEGNILSRTGKDLGVTAGMGVKAAGKSTPEVIQNFATDKYVLQTAIDNINKNTAANIPYSPEGFNRLAQGIEAANIVGKSGYGGLQYNDLLEKTAKALAKDAVFSGWDRTTALQKANQVLSNLIGVEGTADEVVRGLKTVSANQLDDVAKAAFKASNNLAKNAATGIGVNMEDKAILDVVDSVARDILRQNVKGYQGINNLWRALYRQASNVKDVSTPIQNVSQAGMFSPVKAAAQQGGRLAGSVLRQAGEGFPVIGNVARRGATAARDVAGNIMERTGLGNTVQNIISNPQAMQTIGTAARLLPIGLMGEAQQGQAGTNLMPFSESTLIDDRGTNNLQNENFKNILAMAVLSGEIEPSVANTAISLLGLDKQKTTDANVAKLNTAERTLGRLKNMYDEVGYSGEGVLSRLGGGIRSTLGSIGLSSDVNAYNNLRESVKSQLARALGETGNLSDSDKRDVIEAIPSIGDTPQEAQNKWDYIFGVLYDAKNAYSGNSEPGILFSGY